MFSGSFQVTMHPFANFRTLTKPTPPPKSETVDAFPLLLLKEGPPWDEFFQTFHDNKSKGQLHNTQFFLFISQLWLDSCPDYKYAVVYHNLFSLTSHSLCSLMFHKKLLCFGVRKYIGLTQAPSENGRFSLRSLRYTLKEVRMSLALAQRHMNNKWM